MSEGLIILSERLVLEEGLTSRRGGKLEPWSEGPYRVIRKPSIGTYYPQDEQGKELQRRGTFFTFSYAISKHFELASVTILNCSLFLNQVGVAFLFFQINRYRG